MIRLLERLPPALERREAVPAARITTLFAAWQGVAARCSCPDFYAANGGAVLSVFEGVCTLDGHGFDPMELREFLRMRGCCTLVCEAASAALLFPGAPVQSFSVLRCGTSVFAPAHAPEVDRTPPLAQVYRLLADTFDNMADVRFDAWYADVSLKQRRGLARVFGVAENGGLVSTAGIYHQNACAAVIGSVATAPFARGRGYAGALVLALAQSAAAEGKAALIAAKNPRAASLYTGLGFVPVAKLAELALPYGAPVPAG